MTLEYGERLDLEDAPPRLVAEHLARYAYAARFVRGRRVLDVATGTGYGGRILLDGGARLVVGAEIDADTIRRALRDRRTGQLLVVADATQLPIRTASLDCAVSIETIEHLPDAERAVAEIARALVPGSPFVVTTPNRLSSEIPHENPYHVREFDATELINLLTHAFTIDGVGGQYLASSGLRHAGRRWLAGSRSAQLARATLPGWLRTRGGRTLAGAADVIEVADLVRARPATLVVVAIRH